MRFDTSTIIPVADISYGQGYPPRFPVVNFLQMRNYGFRGLIQKASQGNYEDPSFKYNWVACRPILPRSSYHYYDNNFHPRIQAETFWKTIEDDPAGMMWLDLEDRDYGIYYHWDYWYQCLEWLKILCGSIDKIGIYIGHYYMNESMQKPPWATKAERSYFGNYKRWYPWYVSNPFDPIFGYLPTTFPWADEDVLLVQTGTPAIGKQAGAYSGDLDYNLVNGIKSFERIFNTSYEDHFEIKIRRLI